VAPTAVPNLVQIRPRGASGQMGEIQQNFCVFISLFIYQFYGNLPTGQTRQRIFKLDGSNDADSRKGVPFGVSLILLLILGVKSPKSEFWGRE